MPTRQSADAELTLVTPRQPAEDLDRAQVGAELDEMRGRLGMSQRALADQIGVDRETLRKVLDGDPTVGERKWREVNRKIRALDEEMGDEAEPTDPSALIEFHVSKAGDVVVKAPIGNIAEWEDAVVRLMKQIRSSDDD